jgi:hypothetical protein
VQPVAPRILLNPPGAYPVEGLTRFGQIKMQNRTKEERS